MCACVFCVCVCKREREKERERTRIGHQGYSGEVYRFALVYNIVMKHKQSETQQYGPDHSLHTQAQCCKVWRETEREGEEGGRRGGAGEGGREGERERERCSWLGTVDRL